MQALGAKCASPSTTVVVLGNTGAGKSTLLNAIIGEKVGWEDTST